MQTQIAQGEAAQVSPAAKEFRIFRAGENPTLEGSFHFDAAAAQSVLAARASWGVDVMVDLEHLSTLPKESPKYDPDARAYCRVELRGGELWAVAVRWTEDAISRLKSGKQRYISPTFYFNESGGIRRITELFNLALVAMPKTLMADSLWLAASATLASSSLTASERRICRETKCPEHLYAQMKRRQSLGAEVLPEEEEIRVRRIVSVPGILPEQQERLTLIARLISLGSETASTAYRPMTSDTSPIPCDRLQREPIESLRTRTQALADYSAGQFGLTPNQLKICADLGCNPADYAALQATRNRS